MTSTNADAFKRESGWRLFGETLPAHYYRTQQAVVPQRDGFGMCQTRCGHDWRTLTVATEGCRLGWRYALENEQMEQPKLLTKIHKLLGKLPRTKEPKELGDDRRKKRKSLEEVDDLNDDALVPIEDDAGKDDPDYKPSIDHTTAPTTEVLVDPKAKVEKPCLLETSKVWAVTPLGRDANWNLELARYLRSLHDNVCGATSAALQRLLMYLFSLDAVSKVAGFAASLRENSDLIAAALAGQDASKLQPDTPFQILGYAIKVLLTSEAKDVLSEAEVLSTFANTGRLLHHHVEILAAKDAGPAPQYEATFAEKPDAYGKYGTVSSYRAS